MHPRLTAEEKALITEMREQGETWKHIGEVLGRSHSNLCSAYKKGFVTACRYICRSCGGPTNSERKLCHKPDCRKIYLREFAKENWRRYQYGLTPETLAQLIAEQGGKCALPGCGQELTEENMHIDHDHLTGCVRGVLCRKHNNGLGYFDDDPAMLRAAADYLDGVKCPHQLSLTTAS